MSYKYDPNKPIIEKPADCTGVLIIVPAYGQVMTAHTATMLYTVGGLLTQSKIPNNFLWFSMSEIVEARNVFLTLWYDHHPQHSHMLMIDSDMHVNPGLIKQMIEFDKPVQGIFYRKRELTKFEQWAQLAPAVRAIKPVPDNSDLTSVWIGHPYADKKEVVEIVHGGFMRARHVGGGVMMIQRKAVSEMLRKMPDLMDHSDIGSLARCGVTRVIRAFEKTIDSERKNMLSEDYAFCERWLQCGGEVWANVHHEVAHIGPYNYKYRYLDYLQPAAAQATEPQQAAVAAA